jgi:uncharacterized protein DUF4245
MDDVTASESEVAASRSAIVRPQRPAKTFADMARSLGLMAVVIAALLLIGPARTLIFPNDAKRAPVDYTDALATFERTAPQALAPTGLPSDWVANAGRFTPQHRKTAPRLHIGWATPGELYVGLDETTGPSAPLVREVLGRRGATTDASIVIGGLTWQHRRSDRGEDAYTTTSGDVTVVVTGDGTPSQLREMLTALHPASAG